MRVRRGRGRVVAAVIAVTLAGFAGTAGAAFTATRSNTSTFTASSNFNTYPEAVTADAASPYYRLDDSPASSTGTSMTDSGGPPSSGTFDARTDGASLSIPFEDTSTTTAQDTSGNANPGTMHGSTSIGTTGRSGSTATFSADGSVATTTMPVHTNQSFTASLWVKLTDADGFYRTALAAKGSTGSAFELQYRATSGKWAFTTSRSDTYGPVEDIASATSVPALGTWTLLTGVYDSAAGTIKLYVNGTPENTAAHPTAWDAQSSLEVGQTYFGGTFRNMWRGVLDDVRLWQRALSAEEVSTLYAGGAVGTSLMLSWPFSEGTGTTTADTSASANTGTLWNGATWEAGRSGYGIRVGNGYITSSTSPFRTTAAFTVSAWVNLSATGGFRTIVSQPLSGTCCAYWLQYHQPTNRWRFSMSNVASAASPTAAGGTSVPALNTWTHVVGAYTGSAIKLYVNGSLEATTAYVQTDEASGPLRIGQAVSDLSNYDQWRGSIDDLRTWQRALSDSEVSALYSGVGDAPSAEYLLDEGGSSSTSTDSSAHGKTATRYGNATWSSGGAYDSSGNHLEFDGNLTSYVAGTSPAVRTDQSFTVSAWVRATDFAVNRTAVSMTGTNTSTFFLQYYGSPSTWQFAAPRSDSSAATIDRSSSTTTPATGTWTLLAGVYDAAAQTIQLYVNGVAQGSPVAHPSSYAASTLWVGRAMYAGNTTDPWRGGIDDVRLWQRPLVAAEVSALASAQRVPAPVSAGRPGALQGAQQMQQSHTAIAVSGTGNVAHSAAVATAPTTFSLECWFKTTGTLGGRLLGFDSRATGASGPPGFYDRILYLGTANELRFGLNLSGTTRTVASTQTNLNDGTWHHVAVSVSATTGAKMYVDGALSSTDATMTPTAGYAGYWRVGTGSTAFYDARPFSDFVVGSLDEVAVYPTALTAQQVAQHYLANH